MLTCTASLDEVDGEVEALDQFCVLDACDKQLGHLHLQEVRRQAPNFLVIDLQLHGEERGRVWSNFKDGRQAEERHAAEHLKLLFFEAVARLGWLRLY